MSVERRAAWGALTGGISMLVHLAVAFLLAPILLRHLGDASYGVWVLVLSFTGYFGLFDLGIRSAVVRFVAAHNAEGDHTALGQVVSTALWAYSAIGAIVLLLAMAAARVAQRWFHIPPESAAVVHTMVLLLGLDTAVGLPCSVFGGVLEGLQRFAFVNLTQIAVSLARGALIAGALHAGGGLLAVTVAAVVAHFAGAGVIVGRGLSFLPALSLRAGLSRTTLRRIAGHSGSAFVMAIADRLRFQADALVLGVFSAPAAIAYFALAARLSDALGSVVQMMALVVTPASSSLYSAGQEERLREVLVRANQVCAWLMLPGAVLLVLCGRTLIGLWVGNEYVGIYPVFLVLLFGKMLFFSQAAAPRVLLGIGFHGRFVRLLACEALLNLALSIILVRRWGVTGVALGTALPMATTAIVLLPRLLARRLGVSPLRYLRAIYAAPALCAAAILILGSTGATLPLPAMALLTTATVVGVAALLWRMRRHLA